MRTSKNTEFSQPHCSVCFVVTVDEWEGWRCRGNQTGWRLQGPWEGTFIHFKIVPIVHVLSNSILMCFAMKWIPPSFTHINSVKGIHSVYAHSYQLIYQFLTCITREQIPPAKQLWRSSIKHQSTSSPIQQQELSFPCSTRFPKSVDRWIVQVTPNLRASWGNAWLNMDGIWERTPTLVRTMESVRKWNAQ